MFCLTVCAGGANMVNFSVRKFVPTELECCVLAVGYGRRIAEYSFVAKRTNNARAAYSLTTADGRPSEVCTTAPARADRGLRAVFYAVVLSAMFALIGGHSACGAEIAWSMVVITDTQYYHRNAAARAIFDQMTQWIVENKDSLSIQVVLHEGDITDNNTAEQWANAASTMGRLNGQVPYIVVPGNHDYYPYTTRSSTKINSYFHLEDNPLNNSPDGIVTTQYVAGQMDNVCSTFTAPDGRKMLIFGLEFIPRQEVINWARSIAAQPAYEGYTAVLLTHDYLSEGPATPDGEPTSYLNGNGGNLWGPLVSKTSNFELVFNGHNLDGNDTDPEGHQMTARLDQIGDMGNTVHAMAFNTHALPDYGTDGYMRLVEFLDDGTTVQVQTYSPYLDQWLTSNRNEFQVSLTPVTIAGDYDRDGDVDEADYRRWRVDFGTAVEQPGSGADGNGDGIVDAADYTIWRDNLHIPPGDYDSDGDVDLADYDRWRDDFGATVATPGSGADGNSDGIVDAADYTVWRDNLLVPPGIPGDYNADGIVDEDDYACWRAAFGTTVATPGAGADGNGDGVVDAADYTAWRDRCVGTVATVVASVPEPSTLAVFAQLLVAGCLIRPRYVRR